MKKEYERPLVEILSLITKEPITDDELLDGETGLASSIFPE